MSDDSKLPEGLDEFLASPASAPLMKEPVGSPLSSAVDSLVGDGPMPMQGGPGIPEQGLQAPLIDPIDVVGGALAAPIAGRVAPAVADAIAEGVSAAEFKSIVGNEVGSIKVGKGKYNISGPKFAPTYALEEAGPVEYAPGLRQKLETKLGHTDIMKGSPLTATEQQVVTQVEGRKVRKGFSEGGQAPVSMAKGGEVKGKMYAPVATIPVASAAVSAPLGLEEFLNTPPTSDSLNTKSEGPGVSTLPPGLDDFISDDLKQEKYGTLGQQGKAALEGAAQGLLGPIAPATERLLGVKHEDILGRAEANPITHMGAEVAGLVAPALITGGGSLEARGALSGLAKFTQSGALEAAGRLLPEAGTTLASKVGIGAAKAAVDNMLIAGSDEVSRLILNDPGQSAETAIANVGLAGAIGGTLGGALGAAGPLWKATAGDKASKLIEDFKGRIGEHINNPDPVSSVTTELGDYYKKITSLGDDVYGPSGLKARDIEKALPELNDKIAVSAQDVYGKMEKALSKMTERPESYPERLTAKLKGDLDAYNSALSKENLSSKDVFNATQDLKQSLQSYSKFDKFVKPVDEAYDFVRDSKSLAHELRTSLEDTSVWGKAAERQTKINQAFKEYLPALNDFERKFTVEVAGERQIDPAKIQTYMNQIGKPNAEVKQSMLKNFLDASEKYKKVISDSHANLGLETPVQDAAMNSTLATLKEQTVGGKLADAFIEKGLKSGSLAGTSVGVGIGGLLGGHTGAVVGAVVGEKALSPFFNSILPAIAKVVLDKPTSAPGLKAAVDYGVQVAKGEAALTKAAKSIFKAGAEVIPQAIRMTAEKSTEKLDKMLQQIRLNPQMLFAKESDTHSYLPNHGMAVDQSVGNAVTYLNSLRPDLDKKSPLDSTPVPSTTQKAAYNNALIIAQQPLSVLEKVKAGTITAQDIQTLGTLYPSLYNRMAQKLTSEIIDVTSKGEMIPYKTRIGVSMFLGQPLDSTMNPMSIQAAQISRTEEPESQQSAQMAPKGSKSAPALQKMPNMYRTPGEARAARAQKD